MFAGLFVVVAGIGRAALTVLTIIAGLLVL